MTRLQAAKSTHVSVRRRLVAAGLNDTDMEYDGSRFCLLDHYVTRESDKNSWPTVARVIKAWGVTMYYEIDQPPRPIDRDSGRRLMGKFADGLWRYMNFGGVNGPPCGMCEAKGFAEPTGLAAWLAREIAHKEEAVSRLKEGLTAAERDLQFYYDALKKEKPEKTQLVPATTPVGAPVQNVPEKLY